MSVINQDRPQPPHMPPSRSSSSSFPKPKGILKNAQHASSTPHSLQWDEENIALTEINKDSLMKITEPKTPYVRYNPLTDEVEGDIPDLNLSAGYHSSVSNPEDPASPVLSVSPTGADTSGPSSRRTSFSSTGRPGTPGRPGSGASSRSTSFNLPNEARRDIHLDGAVGDQNEVEEDEEMDEEAAAKHAAFVRARKGHYSNEAEAMKRAAQLMDDEEDDDASVNKDNDDDQESFDQDDEEEVKAVPPVPPLPKGLNGLGDSARP